MQIAAHVLAYNVNRFLKPVLENIEPYVDKIYVAHSEKPFGYVDGARETHVNPTTLEDVRAASSSSKVEIITGDWITEEDMRNDCLKKARADGFDWFIIQDADEFYSETSWKQIRRILLHNESDDHIITTWYFFWKSSHFVIMDRYGSIKFPNAGFAVRCASDINFVDRRLCNNQQRKVIDCPSHHYSWVQSDKEILEKLTTWGHGHELFSDSWFKTKWVNWNESTQWLHPVHPMEFLRAIPFPLEQPDFAEQFSLPISPLHNPSFSHLVSESFYDVCVHAEIAKRDFKKVVKSIIRYNTKCWYFISGYLTPGLTFAWDELVLVGALC
jgi:hypothetical protein